ncbi:hypothetical protein L9F63_023917 [Diploptera punctata]|uniref:Uncharacterized protein n=1 Tax=Diploptera punctata TaxID=6984 RepID=A0AAD8E8T7_DIPPU|nr:hypothetical protein L9F63_023917 [Diploptera punctata]
MLVIVKIILTPAIVICQEEDDEAVTGGDYLKSVMLKLQSEKVQPNTMWKIVTQDRNMEHDDIPMKIMGPTPLPISSAGLDVSASQQNTATSPQIPPPPPQPLSKQELAALYEAAVKKGAVLDIASMTSGSVQSMQALQNLFGMNMNKNNIPENNEEQGYYYYFYPIKSFETEQFKTNEKQQHAAPPPPNKPLSNMASMVPTAMMVIDGGSNKSVEPLFMAIAGFVGMALMFAFSVLFFPKFGNLRSRGITALKHAPDELAALTKLVLEGIDGKDCSERLSCEIGRAVRKLHLDKKPIRLLEILLPQGLSKQVQMIRKAAAKKEKCNFIPCKWKGKGKGKWTKLL